MVLLKRNFVAVAVAPERDAILRARAEKWRPWRAYATLHLWLKYDER